MGTPALTSCHHAQLQSIISLLSASLRAACQLPWKHIQHSCAEDCSVLSARSLPMHPPGLPPEQGPCPGTDMEEVLLLLSILASRSCSSRQGSNGCR